MGQRAYAGVAVTSLGGPLALAALYAPSIAGGASSSAGLAMLAAAVAFGFPLAVWFGYARHVSGPGGPYSFSEAAAGRRVALAQAGPWALSEGAGGRRERAGRLRPVGDHPDLVILSKRDTH
jgi:hypothetical protein